MKLRTQIGPYDILASIGTGRMGEVFRARDTRLNREVAVKALPNSRPGTKTLPPRPARA